MLTRIIDILTTRNANQMTGGAAARKRFALTMTLMLVFSSLFQSLPAQAMTDVAAPGGEPASRLVTGAALRDDADTIMLDTVWLRLLSVADRPVGLAWPPMLHVLSDEEMTAMKMDVKMPNAFATLYEGKPLVCITPALLTMAIEGNSDRLAYVVGHELSHITLGHVRRKTAGTTQLQVTVYSSEQELAADKQGMKLALAAGYNFKEALGAPRRLIEEGLDRPPLWPGSHPSWTNGRIQQWRLFP